MSLGRTAARDDDTKRNKQEFDSPRSKPRQIGNEAEMQADKMPGNVFLQASRGDIPAAAC